MSIKSEDWENIGIDPLHHELYRLEVPGGWLLMMMTATDKCALTFYPDPEHKWNP